MISIVFGTPTRLNHQSLYYDFHAPSSRMTQRDGLLES